MVIEFICAGKRLNAQFTVKRVKNINLRVSDGGLISISAPFGTSAARAELFLQQNEAWIERALARRAARAAERTAEPLVELTDAQALEIFKSAVEAATAKYALPLNFVPQIKVKTLKSRWGICYPDRRLLIFNKRLLARGDAALEYVVLHELVHFFYRDHGRSFHAAMLAYMPDYKIRRKLLR